MPTTYAHDLFGTRVLSLVPEEISDVILKHESIFRIGLHGPDILFYYHPFRKNRVFAQGQKLHYALADQLFKEFLKEYRKDNNEHLLAYILGFLCHFMLDSNCHPYIGRYLREHEDVSHDAIETEMDRFLMEKTGKDPFHYHPACVIRFDQTDVRTITRVLKPMTDSEIKTGLKGMRFFTGITVISSPMFRRLVFRLLKTFQSGTMEGRVMHTDYRENCVEGREVLISLFEQSVPECADMMRLLYENRMDENWTCERLHRNFE